MRESLASEPRELLKRKVYEHTHVVPKSIPMTDPYSLRFWSWAATPPKLLPGAKVVAKAKIARNAKMTLRGERDLRRDEEEDRLLPATLLL
jgi:hypothetical protein